MGLVLVESRVLWWVIGLRLWACMCLSVEIERRLGCVYLRRVHPSSDPTFPPSHHPSLLSPSLISPIKDILCSPPAMALQQQIRQFARTHTHHLLWGERVGCWKSAMREIRNHRWTMVHLHFTSFTSHEIHAGNIGLLICSYPCKACLRTR